jgi:hypothetical protein
MPSSTADTVLGLDNSIHYGTDGTVISTVLELGDIKSSIEDVTVTTAGDGDYNNSEYPIESFDKGSATTAPLGVVVTFTSDTAFGCTVDGVSVGNGNTSEDFQPAKWGSHILKIRKEGWTGTWASGDTLKLTIKGSYKAIWMREKVPPGTEAYSGNRVSCTLDGQES